MSEKRRTEWYKLSILEVWGVFVEHVRPWHVLLYFAVLGCFAYFILGPMLDGCKPFTSVQQEATQHDEFCASR